MKQIIRRLTPFVWYAAPLDLTGNFDWKNRIRILRRINPAGAGYVSFDPARQANSLTTINTGDSLTLDATGILNSDPATFFTIENGDAPVPRPAPDTMGITVPVGPPGRTIDYVAMRLGKPVDVLGLSSPGPVQVFFSLNGGPYLSDADVSQAIAALPAEAFDPAGPGCTLKPRLVIGAEVFNEYELTFLIQQTEY